MMAEKIQVCILGATGSIGDSTLDVISQHQDRFAVFALSAHRNVDRMAELCQQFQPKFAVMADEHAASRLQKLTDVTVLAGVAGLQEIASHADVDCVVAAIVGAAGLLPTLAAAKAGKKILLANKEALVMSGPLFMQAVCENNATLLPVDSEHNAIFQCMPAGYQAGRVAESVRKILLTASGGPFLNRELQSLSKVTPEEAVAHPNWSMGKKISVDSATMMNKGLEVIEAHYLFALPLDRIEVVIHPQSIIHSLVDYCDGSMLAQMGNPDMRIPIAHVLAWPERIETNVPSLDLRTLEFQPVDLRRFPCLQLAYDALNEGVAATTVLNAANEMAVQAFLDGDLGYCDIPKVIADALEHNTASKADTLEEIIYIDAETRARFQALVG